MHIGETGWASIDQTAYGAGGSKAADEYKQKVFHDLLREWTDEACISLFFFEAFDEQWKKATSPGDSENRFGLIALNNEVKYALWDAFDAGTFDGLTRDGEPLRRVLPATGTPCWRVRWCRRSGARWPFAASILCRPIAVRVKK